jgi:hypothetical protein
MEETKTFKDDALGLQYQLITVPDLSQVTQEMKTIDEVPSKEIKLYDSIVPHRLEGETHEEFRVRRKINNGLIKKHLKGTMFWNSAFMGSLENEKLKQRIEELKKQKANG